MENLFNRIGRSAITAFLSAVVFFVGLFTQNLSDITDASPVGMIVLAALVGLGGLLVEFLRDQWTIQKETGFRTYASLLDVSVFSRLARGLLVGLVGFLAIVVGEWTAILPEFGGIYQIGVATLIMLLNAGIEYFRDRFDLPQLK